ncbi:MAG: helix-turn-helix transcriptional regulator [Ferruginibacter sp.]
MPKMINDKHLQKIIGENIEQIRLFKKKPIKEIAGALDFSGTAYRNIERGITNTSIVKLFEIALLLEVNIVQLFDFDITIIKKDHQKKKVNMIDKKLEENFQQRIREYKEENGFLRKRIEILESILTGEQHAVPTFNSRKSG